MAEKTASLTVLGGPFAGTRCALPESGVVTVGSAEGSTLRLDLPTVSPYHARLVVEAGRVTVHETGADRPLHVNDNPLDPGGTVLRNGDILWLGTPGEDDVVMLQCVLPRRPVEAAPPAEQPTLPAPPPTPGPAVPTPEVETQSLWSFGEVPGEEVPAEEPPPSVAAEPVREEPAEAPAPVPEEVPAEKTQPIEETLVFAEPTLAGATETEVQAAVETAEDVVVVDATEAEADVVEVQAEAAPSPTILMASAEEMAEPQAVSIDFGESVAAEPEPAVAAEPVVAPLPSVEGEAVFAPEPAVEPEPQPLPPVAPPPPAPPAAPPLPAAPLPSPPAVAKPLPSVPPLPARPAAPPRPPSPRPAARPPRPAAPAPAARREAHRPAPHVPPQPAPTRPAVVAPPAEPEVIEPTPAAAGTRRPALLAVAGAAGVLVLAGAAWLAWRLLAGGPSRPRPTPIASATVAPPPLPGPTVAPVAVQPTPMPIAPTPVASTPFATPTPVSTPRATPTPAATPTPRATPTPAAARPTPTPPPGPSAEALAAQQRAAEAQSLLAQAETAVGARQYDAAVTNLDSVLRLDPANARATTLRADAVKRRDLARRRFTAGRTVVQSQKSQKGGGLAGFDTEDADLRASDFLGRVEFEMTPASGIEPGDAWALKVYVVNEGKKAIRVNGLVLGTTVNGAGSGGPLSPRVREVAPQQRALVAETSGKWADGTSSWTAEVTVTGGKGESLKNTIAWR